MNFDDILEQAIEMLQRRKRVSYRALKLQFKMDDEYFDVLKEELIDIQQLAVDQDGKMLVWTGEPEVPPVSSSQLAQTLEPPPTQQDQPIQAERRPEPHPREAERRQLTVMFCDLVDSTRLSSQLDPEDYREVVRDYQQVCSEVIQRYDGHIAQYLGDGLLVYFGYPVAHEEDAQRAIHTGLGILNAIETLNVDLEQNKGVELAVRLGIHTGLVVVGEIGGEGRQEQLALGETPNVASRIQGLAEPNTVIISDATYRLIQGYFDCESLGEHDLRGVSQPIAVYRVLRESDVQSRLDVAGTRGLTPLVGRESESTWLFERWEQAKEGNGQVVLLSGEAGIGKSRLVQVLKDHVAEGAHTRLECRSLPYCTNTALYPITDFLQRTLRFQTDDTPEQKLEKLTQNLRPYRLPLEETVPLFGALLSLPVPEDRYSLLNLTPQRQRQKTLESIVAIILELAERQPVFFILEDLHWTDPTTLELLNLLVDQTPRASVYALLTCRPEFQPSWSHCSYLTEMTVNRLSQPQIERMAEQVVGDKRLPAEVIQQLVDKTDGVPLYVEEMTKAVLESGVLKETNGHYELAGSISTLSIPTTLQDSLMARLDRLVTAKAVAQYAAVIGRQFSYELLQAVSELDETTLQRELGRLVDTELVYQRGVVPGATYIFKHALIQDTAYESLLRSTRQGYHRRIAEVLEEGFPETADTQPELLAHHYTEAGRNEQAVDFWYKAGQRASEHSAYMEAIGHLRQGLALLATLPDTPERIQYELSLQITLGASLMAAKGYAAQEVEHAYTRARELCQQVGETPQLFSVLRGLWAYYLTRMELYVAVELGEQLLRLAQSAQSQSLLMRAHFALGQTLFHIGEFSAACTHVEDGIALFNPQRRSVRAMPDPGLGCFCYAAWSQWILGYPDQCLQSVYRALTLAREPSHAFSLAFVLLYAAICHQYRREVQGTLARAEALMALAAEQGFDYLLVLGQIMAGWAQAEQGHGAEGMTQIRQGLTAIRVAGAEIVRPYFLALLSEVHRKAGQTEEGLRVVAEALSEGNETGQRYYEAELYRLKGELLLDQAVNNRTVAETYFHQALEISRHQQAKSLELRTTTSLARLWQTQGKREEARELLEPVYSWFTEGFDTADLIDAKALLDELA